MFDSLIILGKQLMCAEKKKKTLLIECRCRFSESGMIEGKGDVTAR